jgi:cyclase
VADFAAAALAGADAVLAASVFHYGTLKIREVKEHMRAAGIEVR